MLKVLITIDTEFWPCGTKWPDPRSPHPIAGLDEAYRRGLLGRTPMGDYGLPYLLRSLRRHDLHGVFFVESLSSSAVGEKWLQSTVRQILDAGQEIQLHLHTEWLSDVAMPALRLEPRQNLKEYSLAEQTAIVRYGLAALREAGAPDVIAMRAGNMGGNADTPAAAKAAGLSLDMSFDPSGGRETRALLEVLREEARSDRACPTVPLSFVRDYPGHCRPAQLTAVSFRELSGALLAAVEEEWPYFVILLHSFELVRRTGQRFGPLHPNPVNVERWEQLCEFLAQHRDVLATVGCRQLEPAVASSDFPRGSRTLPLDTARRMAEQLVSRFVQR